MAKRIRPLVEKPIAPMDQADFRAACHGAWGLFSYATSHSFHCQNNDLDTFEPPKLPVPATPPVPGSEQSAHAFPWLCQLWKLLHETLRRIHSPPPGAGYNSEFVRSMLARVLSLGDKLPVPLVRGNKTTHDGIILHIIFHAGIIMLLRPLVLKDDDSPLGFASHSGLCAKDVSEASVHQLERLVIIYQSRFARWRPTVFWHTGLLYLANHAVRSVEAKPMRTHGLQLALAGYRVLCPQYPVTLSIVQKLLAMAVAGELTTTREVYQTIRHMRGRSPQVTKGQGDCCFTTNLDMSLTKRNGENIDHLASHLDDLIMFDEFTHDRADEHGAIDIA